MKWYGTIIVAFNSYQLAKQDEVVSLHKEQAVSEIKSVRVEYENHVVSLQSQLTTMEATISSLKEELNRRSDHANQIVQKAFESTDEVDIEELRKAHAEQTSEWHEQKMKLEASQSYYQV